MMPKVRNTNPQPVRKGRRSLDPESRMGEMVSLAVNLAEQQLRDGTASSQVITHYLKQGSMREQLELERLREENRLLRAKTEALQEAKEYKTVVEDALKAMQRYKGVGEPDEYQD